jgi:alanine dehydrogenase
MIHYCVANMQSAVARTSTLALTNATLPYALEIADKGWVKAMQRRIRRSRPGRIMVKGKVTYRGVSKAFGLPYIPVREMM